MEQVFDGGSEGLRINNKPRVALYNSKLHKQEMVGCIRTAPPEKVDWLFATLLPSRNQALENMLHQLFRLVVRCLCLRIINHEEATKGINSGNSPLLTNLTNRGLIF